MYSEKIFLGKSSCFKWLLSFQYDRCCFENITASVRNFFGDWCSEIYRKKVRWQNWMAANFNARKMYSTIERMEWLRVFYRDNYSTFERTHTWNQLFSEINILLVKELLKQWLTTSSPVKINTVPFKEWMTAILLVKKKRRYYTTSKDEWLEWWNK